MNCPKCNSENTVEASCKHSDMIGAEVEGQYYEGYQFEQQFGFKLGTKRGWGDYLHWNVCMDCQHKWFGVE